MKEERMFNLVEQWLASGLKKTEFLKDIDCSRSSFNNWLKRYNRLKPFFVKESISNFQEIHLPTETANEEKKIIELTTASGTHIIIYG